MNKKDLVKKISEQTNLSMKDVDVVLRSFISVVREELEKGGKITLNDFGSFEVKEKAARIARNPRTGEAVEIEASRAPKFKPSKAFKDQVAGK